MCVAVLEENNQQSADLMKQSHTPTHITKCVIPLIQQLAIFKILKQQHIILIYPLTVIFNFVINVILDLAHEYKPAVISKLLT